MMFQAFALSLFSVLAVENHGSLEPVAPAPTPTPAPAAKTEVNPHPTPPVNQAAPTQPAPVQPAPTPSPTTSTSPPATAAPPSSAPPPTNNGASAVAPSTTPAPVVEPAAAPAQTAAPASGTAEKKHDCKGCGGQCPFKTKQQGAAESGHGHSHGKGHQHPHGKHKGCKGGCGGACKFKAEDGSEQAHPCPHKKKKGCEGACKFKSGEAHPHACPHKGKKGCDGCKRKKKKGCKGDQGSCPFGGEKGQKVKFTPGAQAFLRGFGRLNPDFDNSDKEHLSGVLQRIRVSLRAKYGIVSAYGEVQDARLWGFEQSTVSNDANTDLHQGYLQFDWGYESGSSELVRLGRQEINWGSKRMIANLGWHPVARSFDAVRITSKMKKVEIDAFAAILSPVSDFVVTDNTQDPPETQSVHTKGSGLFGARVIWNAHDAFNIDVNALGIVEDAKELDPNFDRKIESTGARLWGQPVPWFRYEAEGYYQIGKVNTRDHRAWAGSGDLRFIAAKQKIKPTLILRYAIASGEACTGTPAEGCGSDESNEFFNFFPLNHAYYGLVDLFGWRNMRNAEVGVSMKPHSTLKLDFNYHHFQLHEATGRWSNAGGQTVGAGWDPNNTDHNLGSEIDFVATYKPWKVLMVQPGYGVFIPTGAGKTLGGDDPQHFLYLWLLANF